jgi:hypothetical protein
LGKLLQGAATVIVAATYIPGHVNEASRGFFGIRRPQKQLNFFKNNIYKFKKFLKILIIIGLTSKLRQWWRFVVTKFFNVHQNVNYRVIEGAEHESDLSFVIYYRITKI